MNFPFLQIADESFEEKHEEQDENWQEEQPDQNWLVPEENF